LSREETALNFSGQHLGAGDAVLIANDISDMGALSSLNLANNNLGGLVLPEGWQHTGYSEWTYSDGSKVRETPGKPEGIIAIANVIPDMGAILSVNLLKNNIPMEQAKALASILKDHPTLKSLCGSSGEETVLDMSGQSIGAEGAIMLAPEIADNRALSVANVMGNRIGKEMLSELQKIMRSKPNLISLCGIAGDATEADLSGVGMDADDAIILASELPDKGKLTLLNLAQNDLGELVLSEGWTKTGDGFYDGPIVFKHADGREQKEGPGSKPEGIIAIANAIPDMGALTSLDISENELHAEGTKLLAEAVKGNQIMTALNISSNYLTFDGKDHGDMTGVAVLADAMPGMGALTSLHVGKNNIPKKEMKEIMAIAMRMDSMKILCEVPFKDKTLTELDVSGKNLGSEGALVVAEYLDGNGPLQCTDGTPYQPEKSFMMSTHVCRHCGQHKTQHTSQ
jgi:hypothetical protein